MTMATESSEDQQAVRTRASKKREITLDNIRTYMPTNRPHKRPYAVPTEDLQTGHNTFQTLPGSGAAAQESSAPSGPTTTAPAPLADEEDNNAPVAAPSAIAPSARDSDVPSNLPTPFRWKGMTNEESNHQLALLCQALIDFVQGSEVFYTSKFKLMRAFIAAEAYPPHMKGLDELMIKNKLFFASKKAQSRTKSGLQLVPHEELLLRTLAALENHVAQSKTPGFSTNSKSNRPLSSSGNTRIRKEDEDDEEEEEEEDNDEGNVMSQSLISEEDDMVITESAEPASLQSEAHPTGASASRPNNQNTRKSSSMSSASGVSSFRTVQSTFNNSGRIHIVPETGTASAHPFVNSSSSEIIGLDPVVLNSLVNTMDVLGKHINSMTANQANASKTNPRQLKALGETLATLLGEVVECKSSLRGIESKLDYLDKKIDVLNNSYRDGLLQMQKSLIESLLRATMPSVSDSSSR